MSEEERNLFSSIRKERRDVEGKLFKNKTIIEDLQEKLDIVMKRIEILSTKKTKKKAELQDDDEDQNLKKKETKIVSEIKMLKNEVELAGTIAVNISEKKFNTKEVKDLLSKPESSLSKLMRALQKMAKGQKSVEKLNFNKRRNSREIPDLCF